MQLFEALLHPGEAAEGEVDEARHQPAAAAPPQPVHQAAAGHDGGEGEPGRALACLQVQQQGQTAAVHSCNVQASFHYPPPHHPEYGPSPGRPDGITAAVAGHLGVCHAQLVTELHYISFNL